jgi:hypothetical protein
MRELPEEILLHIFEVLAHQRPSTRFLLPVLQVCGLWKVHFNAILPRASLIEHL